MSRIKGIKWACKDCMLCLVNGDISGLDDERAAEVADGCQGSGNYSAWFDTETRQGIDYPHASPCAFCGTDQDSEHYRFARF